MKILNGWTKIGRTLIISVEYEDKTQVVWIDFWDMKHNKLFYLFLIGLRKSIRVRNSKTIWAPNPLGPKECSISFHDALNKSS